MKDKKINLIEEIQSIELDMLRQLHVAFEEYNLRYCLAYGTLLGAVRHGGFIPWDDDVDIMMFRPDFEYLRQNAEKIFAKTSLKLAFYDRDDCYYPRPFAKIIDKRTRLTETNYDDGNEIGVFVDVFVLDGVPSNNILCAFHRTRCILLKKLFYASVTDNKEVNNIFLKRIIKIAHLFNKNRMLSEIDRLCKKYDYNKSEFVINLFNKDDNKLPKQSFELKKMKFGNLKLFVPVDYDVILKNRYGDYLQLPPSDQQIPSHPYNAFWK